MAPPCPVDRAVRLRFPVPVAAPYFIDAAAEASAIGLSFSTRKGERECVTGASLEFIESQFDKGFTPTCFAATVHCDTIGTKMALGVDYCATSLQFNPMEITANPDCRNKALNREAGLTLRRARRGAEFPNSKADADSHRLPIHSRNSNAARIGLVAIPVIPACVLIGLASIESRLAAGSNS